jgi:hypothetical protein
MRSENASPEVFPAEKAIGFYKNKALHRAIHSLFAASRQA